MFVFGIPRSFFLSLVVHVWAGFFLLIMLGGAFGLIFGARQRGKLITAGRALSQG